MNLSTIAELRRLLAEATPGTWHRELLMPFQGQTWLGVGTEARPVCIVSGVVESPEGNRNVAFIIGAHNLLPELLDAAERLAKLESALDHLDKKDCGIITDGLGEFRCDPQTVLSLASDIGGWKEQSE